VAQVLEYIEGFDEVAGSDIIIWGWSGGTPTIQTGRFSGNSCGLTNLNLLRGVPANAEYLVGFAWRPANASSAQDLLRFFEGATEHGRFTYNGNGTFTISRGGNIPATSSAQGVATNGWYFIEVYYKCHDTTGAWEVRFNGVSIIGPTGSLDTRNGGTGVIDAISLRSNVGTRQDFDDVYLASGGSAFYGDCRVLTKFPTADGTNVDLTPSTGGTHFDDVDDATPNSDTDYVSSGVSGLRDSFTFPALGLTGTVIGVQPSFVAEKTDAGVRSAGTVIRRGGVNYDGNSQTLGAVYGGFAQVYETDPNTSAAWTVANVNAAEFGVKVTA